MLASNLRTLIVSLASLSDKMMHRIVFRSAINTCSRSLVRPPVVGSRATRSMVPLFSLPRVQISFVRHNSSKPQLTKEEAAARREALKKRDELQKDWAIPVLEYEVVKQKSLQPSEHAYLIDVREPDEVIQGNIPSSVNLPLSVLSGSLQLPATQFHKKHGFSKPGLDQEIVFYCRSGKRSATASDVAKRNGYTNIFNYKGSWLDWVEREGKPSA